MNGAPPTAARTPRLSESQRGPILLQLHCKSIWSLPPTYTNAIFRNFFQRPAAFVYIGDIGRIPTVNPGSGDITQLLMRWAQGDREALNSLAPLVQAELRRIADSYLRRQNAEHILQPTALVNEAWLRLVKQEHPSFESRKRFFALAAQAMRQILIDYARTARADKRGGGEFPIALPESLSAPSASVEQFLALNEALEQLAVFSPRQAQVVELRYFGGLNVDECADLLGVSPATVSREQRSAEAWLGRAMAAGKG